MKHAENELLKHCQLESFASEFVDLSEGLHLKATKLISLSPFVEDSLIRVGGRLDGAYIPYSSKHQVIISSNHPLASLLISYIHVNNFHSGRDLTLNLLRESYWIINAKSLIRKVLNDCMYCKRLRIHPNSPFMSDLPPERLSSFLPPFYFTGVDYFGPLTIKLNRKTRGTSGTAKRYGALFTCMTTRAVHLELAGDLSTDSFILALRRFKARRGYPKHIRSDNGSNFIGAEREMKDALSKLDQKKIINELNENRIEWTFNPPKSPWMGGAMESLVKITKKCLKTVIKDGLLNEECVHTVLLEIESIVNSRPLTSVSDDINDLEPITPNHFLIGRPSPNLNFTNITEKDTNSRTRWKAVQAVTNMYWKRWLKEYLPLLTVRKKWTNHYENIRVGDIVLIQEENTERSKWPLARVTELFYGKDGVVRSVKLKTKDSILQRPVAKLCVLEEATKS